MIRLLGAEVFAIETGAEETAEETEGSELAGGTTYSFPVGFTEQAGDQRWDKPIQEG